MIGVLIRLIEKERGPSHSSFSNILSRLMIEPQIFLVFLINSGKLLDETTTSHSIPSSSLLINLIISLYNS